MSKKLRVNDPIILPRRIVRGGQLGVVFLVVCALTPGCVRTSGTVPGGCSDGRCVQGMVFDNARIEPGGTPLHPSLEYWLKKGDLMLIKYAAFKAHIVREGKMCSFTSASNDNPDDCHVCNFCEHPSPTQDSDPPCFGRGFAGPLSVVYQGFDTDSAPMPLDPQIFTLISGCSTGTSFTPAVSGIYRLEDLPLAGAPMRTAAETKIHLIDAGLPQTVAYKMDRYEEAARPGYVWYKWSITGDPLWTDNFSAQLRVSKVQILKGTPSMDVNTGRFKLENSMPIRPSRLVFSPNFDPDPNLSVIGQDQHYCYADPNKEDGDLNLANCRRAVGANGQLETATPTYYNSIPVDVLTWFAEFNPCEGCGGPPCPNGCSTGATATNLQAGEVLAIEFTIERV